MSAPINFIFNGSKYTGESGQSIAAALISQGQRVLRTTRFDETPRSIFCGIGICFDCVVVVNGIANQRSCLVEITEGAVIVSKQ
jgi:aerobic-type carbon monoxide dehydrogenase small subunit (CoxS/CutS family)